MARPGITFTDVVKAAQTVQAQGEEPTIDRVRDELGTGSKSTIAPHLKRWKSEYQQQAAWESIPDELAIAAKAVFEKSQRMAQNQIDLLKAAHAKQTENLIGQLNALEQDGTQQTTRFAELTNTYKNLEAESASFSNENQTLREAATLATHKHQSYEEAITQLNMRLSESHSDKQAILKQFEHYQATMANERRTERHTFERNTQKLEATAEQQRQKAEQFKRDNALLSADCVRLQHDHHALSTALKHAENETATQLAKTQMLTDANKLLAQDKQDLHQAIIKLTANVASAQTLEHQTQRDLRIMKSLLNEIELDFEQ